MTQDTDIFELDFPDMFSDMEEPQDDSAYVKKEITKHGSVWMIYNGLGEKMGYAANRETAMAIVRQSELTAHNVH